MEPIWQPLVSSCIVSLFIGVGGLVILCKSTQKSRKLHVMNVFNQQAFALLFVAFLVRSFQWLIWLDPGQQIDPSTLPDDGKPAQNLIGMSISVRAFLLTFPSMNFLICAFLIQYPWYYDYIVICHGREINLRLRHQWKTLVVATRIFTLLMYLVYLFNFPMQSDKSDGRLFELYKTIMVFEIISGMLVICQIASTARKIEMTHRELARAVKRQGFVFLFSNVCASIFYYLMGKGTIIFGHLSLVPCIFAQLAFYLLTETLPLLSFVQLQNKLVELHGLENRDQPAADQQNQNQVNPEEREALAGQQAEDEQQRDQPEEQAQPV